MKVNVRTELQGYNGKPIAIPGEDGTNWTLARACCEALTAIFGDEQDIKGDEKLTRYLLASKIHNAVDEVEGNGSVDLKAEDVALLKRLVAKLFGPNIVGPAWQALEGEDQKKADD